MVKLDDDSSDSDIEELVLDSDDDHIQRIVNPPRPRPVTLSQQTSASKTSQNSAQPVPSPQRRPSANASTLQAKAFVIKSSPKQPSSNIAVVKGADRPAEHSKTLALYQPAIDVNDDDLEELLDELHPNK